VFRTTPEIRKVIEEIITAEGLTITDLLERAMLAYDRQIRPDKAASDETRPLAD
jgi:hypothetical protein